jgi:thiopeptide-type bacteriocin biosynthesis protein
MPSHQLVRPAIPAEQIADAVLSVLAGTPAAHVAAETGIEPDDLDEAVLTYLTAGHNALERLAEQDCYQVRVHFPDWASAETTAAQHLGPRLDELHAAGAVSGWWFLRKHPCWRIRLHGQANLVDAVPPILDELTDAGLLTRWWPTIYEPETAAFGGPTGMHAVHELFCADSRGVLDYLRQPDPRIGRRELTILLCGALLRGAGQDWFEHGDVFDRVARLRPPVPDSHPAQLADAVRTLLAVPAHPDNPLFPLAGQAAAYATPWFEALHTAGATLRRAADAGSLDRGLRSTLSHILIFHWNRLGLSASTQAALATAARLATLPTD